MNIGRWLLVGVVGIAASMAAPGVEAQSVPGARNGLPSPGTLTRTLTPPRPAGLGGNLTPGHGGPNPSLSRRASQARDEVMGLVAVCGPGGALSAQNAAGNPGRTRARALVCPG